jgi:hypothetical protein
VTSYRVTRKDNPSERFEDDFDDVLVSGGEWIFTRNHSVAGTGAGQSFGGWSVGEHIVEIEEHGGTWREIDPRMTQHPSHRPEIAP